jgi:hypothetical protein
VVEGNGFRESTHKFFKFFLFFANVAMKCVVKGNGFRESTHKFFKFFYFLPTCLVPHHRREYYAFRKKIIFSSFELENM